VIIRCKAMYATENHISLIINPVQSMRMEMHPT